MNYFLIPLLFISVVLHAQVTTYENVPYDAVENIDPNLLSLDVYVPDTPQGLMPIAIYVHGGGWCIGDKSNVHDKAKLLTDQGYIFVSLNYRLSPIPFELDNLDRIRYPDHPNDVAKAVAFILDHVSNYGGDTNRVFLFGHSSGAHLVATILTDNSFLNANGYQANSIKCACIMDTGGFELESWITESATDADLFINAFGNEAEIWKAASPIHHVTSDVALPDILLIYQDNLKRILANEGFAEQINNLTSSKASLMTSTYDHQEINQLLGSELTDESIKYTNAFIDWLLPCMAQNATSTKEEFEGAKNNIISQKIRFDFMTSTLIILQDDEYSIRSANGQLIQKIRGYTYENHSLSDLIAGMYIVSDSKGNSLRITVN